MHLFRAATLTIALAALPAAAETVSGTATYLQRMLLPPDAVVEVTLEDVSRADAPAVTLGTFRIESPGAPPYPFAFEIAPDLVDPTARYSLRASVRQNGKLMMITDTAYPVLTMGAGNQGELIMKPIAQPSGASGATPDADFVNTYWKILTLEGQPVTSRDGQREPHLILRDDGSYNATVGCNMIRGGQAVDGTSVTLEPGAMTMMACLPPLDAYEAALKRVLEGTKGYAVDGDTMALHDASGAVIATFEAVYF